MTPYWLAATGEDFPLTGLGQLGAVGAVMTILLTFGWLVYKRERDRADKAQQATIDDLRAQVVAERERATTNAAEIARLNQLIQDRYVPSLESATKAIADSTDALTLARSRRT